MPSAPKLKQCPRATLHGYPKNTLENTELISRGVSIKEIKKQERSLEEFFFNLIKEAESRR
ncbi:MAG: hypothetical protein QW836_09885 [Ignisphaera sp.]